MSKRRARAIILSPLAGSAVIFTGLFTYVDEITFSLNALGILIFYSTLALLIQVFIIETCLFLYSSYYKKVDIKTYYYFAIFCCYTLTGFATAFMLYNGQHDGDELTWVGGSFGVLFIYSLVNIFCYYHLYFKHQEKNHENV